MRNKIRSRSPNLSPVLFGDEWPVVPKCPAEPDSEGPGLTDVKKWRLQMLLALTRWGIPSLAFADAYEKMFSQPLDLKDLGFSSLTDMISKLPEVFAVQEPDDLTALIFPDHPDDRILHDARLRPDFQKTYQDRVGAAFGLLRPPAESTNTNGSVGRLHDPQPGAVMSRDELLAPPPPKWAAVEPTSNKALLSDTEELILRAYYNRDYEFPRDVVLPGEQYSDFILPKMNAPVLGTRGLYQAVIVGAANPNGFYINVNNASLDKLEGLAYDVTLHFATCGEPVEMYSVPDEFIYPGFPCLVYKQHDHIWERGQIVGNGKKANKVLVETVDYGGIVSVDRLFLYLMPRKFLDIPKQAVYVSLIDLKPPQETWQPNSGARIRSFSHSNYWLDILLVDPPRYRSGSRSASEADSLDCANQVALGNPLVTAGTTNSASSTTSTSTTAGATAAQYKPGKYQRRGNKWHKDIEFEALLCDRHDPEVSLHLDQVLTMEGLATYDGARADEISELRKQFDQVLANLPRPNNPLVGGRKRLLRLG